MATDDEAVHAPGLARLRVGNLLRRSPLLAGLFNVVTDLTFGIPGPTRWTSSFRGVSFEASRNSAPSTRQRPSDMPEFRSPSWNKQAAEKISY